MLFRTTLLFAFLFSFTPSLAAPIVTATISERSEEVSLTTRDLIHDISFEERDLTFEERDLLLEERDEDLYELVTRSPEPEPEPTPEMEDVERRGKLGFLVKIGKKIGSLFHKHHKAASAANNNNNNNNQNQHHKRSKIGNKIKNFFKKIGNGIKKAVKFVASVVLRRNPEEPSLQ